MVLATVSISPDLLGDIPFQFNNDKEVVLTAVRQIGWLLFYASNRLKNDKEVVLVAIKKNGLYLKYASSQLKNNKEVVLAAVKQNKRAFQFASKRLQKDWDIVRHSELNMHITNAGVRYDIKNTWGQTLSNYMKYKK